MLILFELSSELQVNFHKSMIIGLNVDSILMHDLAKALWCKQGTLPFTYLGLLIGGNLSHLSLWKSIIDRIEKKLASWKGNLLSLGGRTTLIKASLSSLPLYYMSLFPIPMGIAEQLIKMQCQFLWCGSLEKKKFTPPIAWHQIEQPKSLSGLGIENLQERNLGLLLKWLWRYVTEPNYLWCNIVQIKFGYGSTFAARDFEIPKFGGP